MDRVTIAKTNAMTVALSGCSAPMCLRGTPPTLCSACAARVTRYLAEALAARKGGVR